MLQFLSQGWVGSITGTLGLIVGLIGILLYRISRIGPRLMCQVTGLRLLGKKEQALPEEVEIRFEGRNVLRLTSSQVYLWNAGTMTIRGDQVVEDDPLRCEFQGRGEILKARVASCTRTVNKVEVHAVEGYRNKAILSFDYLDPGDGARVELIHTNEDRGPRVCGAVRGMPQGVLLLPMEKSRTFGLALVFRNTKAFLTTVSIIALCGFVLSVLPQKVLNSSIELRVMSLVTGVLYSSFPVAFYLSRRRRYPLALDDPQRRQHPLQQREERRFRGGRFSGHSSRRRHP